MSPQPPRAAATDGADGLRIPLRGASSRGDRFEPTVATVRRAGSGARQQRQQVRVHIRCSPAEATNRPPSPPAWWTAPAPPSRARPTAPICPSTGRRRSPTARSSRGRNQARQTVSGCSRRGPPNLPRRAGVRWPSNRAPRATALFWALLITREGGAPESTHRGDLVDPVLAIEHGTRSHAPRRRRRRGSPGSSAPRGRPTNRGGGGGGGGWGRPIATNSCLRASSACDPGPVTWVGARDHAPASCGSTPTARPARNRGGRCWRPRRGLLTVRLRRSPVPSGTAERPAGCSRRQPPAAARRSL